MAKNHKIPKCPPLRFPEFADEWKQTTLGETCSVIGGGTPSTDVDDYWNGDIQWFTPSEIGVNKFVSRSERTITEQGMNNSGAKLLPLGTILLTTRATIGEASIATCPCTTNQGCQSLVINRRITTTEFVYQKVETLKRELFSRANGSTFKEISASEVRSISISLPSLSEQEKIAGFLSLIDERIQSCSETIKERKREKAALLNQLFSQKLRFPQFSDEWQQTTLGEIAEMNSGGTPSTTNPNYYGGSIPFLSISDISKCGKYIYQTENYITKEGLRNSSARLFLRDTIMFAMYASVGKVAITKIPISCSQAILGISSTKVYQIFLYYVLIVKARDYSKFSQTGTQMNLSKSLMERLSISLPSLAEQQKIADFLSLIDERIDLEEQLLQEYEQQKKYLLRNMFV
ncbi:restriction endonuclease subunit S [Porphyromonas gingivalis]|uniref:Type I restriction modification DNA specificity domain protein n=1 Tax=Porphyromonas gingivalis F0570 TaxID=1227271 RepID=A0A0E2LQ82_PORGN|nr:restriction endonuclease subunit S [Porphyromonas gingivalis]ERJ65610.1 type I restriction modification DNA specificity domain protein [Porphyromonas gingivalis F0570]